ncbi:MAG: hypothetical protein IT379_39565 [Deltaproteobacteria bacterium]|nr:hypothetical protein [Deltaproteobacteria bacterium]
MRHRGTRGHLATDEAHLEAIAERWRAETHCEPPVSGAEELWIAGVRVIPDAARAAGRACLDGGVVYYHPGWPPDVVNFALLHELGHLLAQRDRCDGEAAASYVAAALAMPRAQVLRVVRRVGRDIPMVRWAFGDSVSHEVVGRRLVDVYPELVLSVWPEGRLLVRYERGIAAPLSVTERDAVAQGVTAGEPGWRDDIGAGAWVVEERRGRVTYVLVDREQLDSRGARAAYDEAVGEG